SGGGVPRESATRSLTSRRCLLNELNKWAQVSLRGDKGSQVIPNREMCQSVVRLCLRQQALGIGNLNNIRQAGLVAGSRLRLRIAGGLEFNGRFRRDETCTIQSRLRLLYFACEIV